MTLCTVGIGGCGGNVSEKVLANQDVTLAGVSMGDHICLGGIKGIWIEADASETAKLKSFRRFDQGAREYHPFFFIPMEALRSDSNTSQIMQQKYGYDLKKQGFHRQAEFLKAVFEIFDMDRDLKNAALEEYKYDNPILRSTWSCIRPYTTMADSKSSDKCDGILFIVSLGGGTGTGFINPITKYIRAERRAFPIFVLAVLTEEGLDKQQNAKEAKRNMGAVISMYDLLGKKKDQGVDGLILVDNQILFEKFGAGNFSRMDRYISQAMSPLLASRSYPGEDTTSLPIRTNFIEMVEFPPILVPCYSQGNSGSKEDDLVKKALVEGRLFGCDPKKADRAFVFSRGFLSASKLKEAVSLQTGLDTERISVWRKLSCESSEVLVLLRNPYGTPGAHNVKGTLENRVHRIMTNALRYMDESEGEIISSGIPKRTEEALRNYFYGKEGMKKKIQDAMARVERGEKPIFQDELRIFGSAQFCMNDLSGPESLAKTILSSQDPLSSYITSTMSEGSRQKLEAMLKDEGQNGNGESRKNELTLALVDELNNLIQGPSLYDPQRFSSVRLTKETEEMAKQHLELENDELMLFNRQLLEEAYPQELTPLQPRAGLLGEEQIRPIVEKILAEKGVIKG